MFNDDQEASILDDLHIYVVLLLVFIAYVILVFVFRMTWKSKRDLFKRILSNLRRDCFWNHVIRAFTVSYIKCLMSVGTQLRFVLDGNEFQEPQEIITAMILGATLLAVPLLAWITL